MMKRTVFLLLILSFLISDLNAEWIPLSDKSGESSISPELKIIHSDDNSMIIDIDIFGFELNELISNGKTYHSVDLLTEMFSAKDGYPELSYISKVIAVPDNAKISVEIIRTGELHTFQNINLKPARESWFEGMPETDLIENNFAYQSDQLYPEESVMTDSPSVFRDFRITRLSVFPMQYIASKNELQVVTSVTVKINFESGDAVNPKTSPVRAIPPSFGKIYRSFIFNYQEKLDMLYNGKEEGHDLMLCIMPDEFFDSFQTYAEWKRQSGIDIHITKFSDIGANGSNPDIIKDHVTDAYLNWNIPPTYVLIVGDDGIFPKKIVSYDYSFPNEDYFVEIEGNDYFPEMMIGRFTNQGDYRMQVMINKFQLYEKYPYTDDPDWFRKGVCCSNNLYESQVGTKRFAADRMMEETEGNFISVDTLMSDGDPYSGIPCSMNLNDVLDAINEGRSFLNYRGEGWSSGWWANCTPFQTDNVSSLNNGEKFTFVTSIGCGVAMFNANGGNCFGEEWVQLGTLTSPRGGVAFIGPTSNTHTTYNNKIDKGIYVGMFREGMDTPGQAMLRGKLYMYNVFGNEYWVEYHYRVFCILGDPSIHIWKDTPLPVTVNYQTFINQLEVTVSHEDSGLPVDSAQVTLTSGTELGDEVFVTGYTNVDGIVNLNLPFPNSIYMLTVRGGNVYPYQTIIQTGTDIKHNDNTGYLLEQNIPNPFISETEINYSISESGDVSVKIYDIKGQLIRTLQNGFQSAGNYTVVWNGINDSGNRAGSGVYYYSLKSGKTNTTKKLMMIK